MSRDPSDPDEKFTIAAIQEQTGSNPQVLDFSKTFRRGFGTCEEAWNTYCDVTRCKGNTAFVVLCANETGVEHSLCAKHFYSVIKKTKQPLLNAC